MQRRTNTNKIPDNKVPGARSKSHAPEIKPKPRVLKVGDEICTKQLRIQALGDIRSCQDKCLKSILQNAEKQQMPKKLISKGDWLCSHKEKDQTFDIYQKPGVKNLVTPARNKIYIFVIDKSILDEFAAKLQRYCEAFYTDMKIQIKKPESSTFLQDKEVPSREGQVGQNQYNANVILKKTLPLVPKDAYCMLTVTMEDLYPFDSWNYVFGWANYVSRTGVFSFGRYHPNFDRDYYGEEEDEEEEEESPEEKKKAENELLENACYVMVHEIGHMFGMTHCTFYEYLCPVCLRKLQSNMQFDVKRRFKEMHKICQEFQFTEMAEYYEKQSQI
ncbi:archaemetzincin-2 isoform x1 [Stylonychia lemnae]|uniref:Archaemetzincin-2 isoform x1 n=1 Tax=Stylonychia lemnae TaxID=5949 RepID=A0A078ADP3_STYLE|nr:archaemetzincin-2 isoform x1 [Stylonychia lemnae]|eukprot:CDW79008.1 archaemetzincin-2 isoform x1 [Stylonychia lemnae]